MSPHPSDPIVSPRQADLAEVEATYRKITRKVIPLLFIGYMLSCVDRINIGFAQLQMKDSLGFSDAVYGLAAAMFFVGYIPFELPSNLLLRRIGARTTMLRIMVLWGLTSAATMFVTTPAQFYLARFLLGVFEAGFVPGVLLYLTFWYPPQRHAGVVALFMSAGVMGVILTAPLSGWILQNMHDVHGLEGWQWMFLLEGLPSVAMGIVTYLMLPDGPDSARWLTTAERGIVQRELEQGAGGASSIEPGMLGKVFRDPKVYLFSFGFFALSCAGYFHAFWIPTILRSLGVTNFQQIGLYAMIPGIVGAVAMLVYGRRSDQRRERRWHAAAAFLASAAGLLLITLATPSLVWTLAAITLGVSSNMAASPVLWAIVTHRLSKQAAPASIAITNSLGNLGGGLSPALVGALKQHTGSLDLGIYIVAIVLVAAAVTLLLATRKQTKAVPMLDPSSQR